MLSLIFQLHGGLISKRLLKALLFQLMLAIAVTSACAEGQGDRNEPNPVKAEAISPQESKSQPAAAGVGHTVPPVEPPGGQHTGPAAEPGKEEQSGPPVNGADAVKPAPTVPLPRAPRLRHEQAEGTVGLNFSDAGLSDILRTIGNITGENFIIAPGITARISVQTTKPIPRKEVFGIFESILEINGLAAVKTGQYYKIVQAPAAKQHAIDLLNKGDIVPGGDRMINMVAPVDFASANDIIQILKPLVSAAGNVVNYQKANTLIITDTASNIKSFLDIIAGLDVDAFKRMHIALIQIKNVDVKTLDRELSEVFAAVGYGKDATQFVMVPVERLNSLILIAPSEALLASSKEWIDRLDQTSTADTASIHIYYVQNDKASTVSTLLEQLYGGKKLTISSDTARSSQPAQPAGIPSPPSSFTVSKKNAGGEDIRIYIYEPSNALIIQSSQRDYQSMLTTLKEIDRPPKQVLIDALICEVTLDDQLKYGIQWSLLSGNFNVQQNTGIFPATVSDPKGIISVPIGLPSPAGLSAIATDSRKFFGAVQALAALEKLTVLSNPHIIVKNYEKASINVGSDEPVATQSTQTAVTGTSGLIQSIEYRKTGIILTVTPQITDGGMVAMTVRQEVSDRSTDRTVGNAVYPSFSNRSAETSVVAKDGESLVIGGLIQDKKDVTTSGIPLLSRIPYLGALFRFTSDTVGKTELVILLTPRVISNPQQAATVSSEVMQRVEEIKELLKKSSYGK